MPRKGKKRVVPYPKGHNRKYTQKVSQTRGANDAGFSFESQPCDRQSLAESAHESLFPISTGDDDKGVSSNTVHCDQQSLTESTHESLYPLRIDVGDNDTGVSFESVHSAHQLSTDLVHESVYPCDASCQTYSAEVNDSACQSDPPEVSDASCQANPGLLSGTEPGDFVWLNNNLENLKGTWSVVRGEVCAFVYKPEVTEANILKVSQVIRLEPAAQPTVYINDKQVPLGHELFDNIGPVHSLKCLNTFVERLSLYSECFGNQDERFQTLTPKSSTPLRSPTCFVLCKGARCPSCSKQRSVLRSKLSRRNRSTDVSSSATSKTTYKNISSPQLRERLQDMKREKNALKMQVTRLREKINSAIERNGEILDNELSQDLNTCMKENASELEAFPKDSFLGMTMAIAIIQLYIL